MRQYAQGQGCLMAYLQTALDDPAPAPCGRCSVCTGALPFPGLAPTPDKLLAARDFLRGMDVEIEPRKRWPAGVSRKGGIRGFEAGRAVAFADDPGWVHELQALRRHARSAGDGLAHDQALGADTSPIPEALLAGALATLGRWSKSWPARPVCVVPLPAQHMAANLHLAAHIARKGRLPLHEVFSWQGGTAPDDTASTPVVAHLEQSIVLSPDAQLPAGPVLLVGIDARTRWTATVAAALLRERGADQVLLLVLHLQA